MRLAGTAAVHFQELMLLHTCDLDFILQHAGGPQHADYVSVFVLAEANDNVGGVLSEITGGAGNLPLLPVAAGEDFNLRADSGLVVVESFERQP